MTRNNALVIGVLNVTPDSFSDGGSYIDTDAAIAQGEKLAALGADIIDVGGESTRPGAVPIAREEELRRVLPVVRALTTKGLTVSIDTLHAETAQAAVAAGARYINDVSGGTFDPGMLVAAAWASGEHGARFIIGHWRGIPDPDGRRSHYQDVVVEVRDALASQARAAIDTGVDASHIVLDPGLGFDKTGEQSWRLIAAVDTLGELGYPVMIGASRKRMVAEVIGRPSQPAERDLATAVVSALAAQAGVWGVRVHDVEATRQAFAVERAFASARSAAVSHAARGDRINVTGLEVFAHHGVYEHERSEGQRFVIDASIAVDLRQAGVSDDLSNTVHYGELVAAIKDAAENDPVDLIESLAERIAAVVLDFPGVRETQITVHKPEAPIDARFSDVSVTITRRPALPVVLAFGANLGDRIHTIGEAQRVLAETPGIYDLNVSRLIESIAVTPNGPDPKAPKYVNGVALARTTLSPHELLDLLQHVEHRYGRVRGERWADRTLDIDLIAYADRSIADGRLTVPHPRAHEREFVLAPWCEIAPDAELVGRGRVSDLLAAVRDAEKREHAED